MWAKPCCFAQVAMLSAKACCLPGIAGALCCKRYKLDPEHKCSSKTHISLRLETRLSTPQGSSTGLINSKQQMQLQCLYHNPFPPPPWGMQSMTKLLLYGYSCDSSLCKDVTLHVLTAVLEYSTYQALGTAQELLPVDPVAQEHMHCFQHMPICYRRPAELLTGI